VVETGPAGTHSVFEILQTHNRNWVHILLQSTPDSIIDDGIYVRTVRRSDRRLGEVGYILLPLKGTGNIMYGNRQVLLTGIGHVSDTVFLSFTYFLLTCSTANKYFLLWVCQFMLIFVS